MKRIFLIGFMGAGKTQFGRCLAKEMNLQYVDTDYFIESRYRKKISEIFAAEGEACFRNIEHKIILELSEYENVVISTGGGLPCFQNNIDLMNEKGDTVYLKASVNELTARLELSKTTRPLLQGKTGEELKKYIEETLEKRRPFYEKAKILFDVEMMDIDMDLKLLSEKLIPILNNYS
jgi:shikimate kinase